MSRKRLWAFRIIALGVGLVIAIGLAEAALRLFRLAPSTGVFTVDERQFRAYPGIFAPNQQLVDRRKPALPHRVTIDSLGFRGPQIARRKPNGGTRILMVGDSFTFGDFVDDDQTLPAQVERELRGACRDARVINAGLGGSTITDAAMMIERALPLQPDLVVLVFSENDVTDLAQPATWAELERNRRAKSRFPLSITYPILRETALWNFALQVRATARVRQMEQPQATAAVAAEAPPERVPVRERAQYHEALVAIHDTLAAHGIPFAFAAYPSHYAVSDPMRDEQIRWVTGLAREEGIPTYDLLPPLRAAGLPIEELYLLPHDGHPSARGYAIAAATLAQGLLKDGLLERACSTP